MLSPVIRVGDRVVFARAHEHPKGDKRSFRVEEVILKTSDPMSVPSHARPAIRTRRWILPAGELVHASDANATGRDLVMGKKKEALRAESHPARAIVETGGGRGREEDAEDE